MSKTIDHDKAVRLWDLIEFLESHVGLKYTASQIANKIMCSQINIVRTELHLLKTWNFPIIYEPIEDTYFVVKTDLEKQKFNLSPSETLSIFFFKELAGMFKGTHAYEQYSSLCRKIGTENPLFYQNFINYVFNNMTISSFPKIELSKIVESQSEIMEAIEQNYEIEAQFIGSSKLERRRNKRCYQPLMLKFKGGELYCYARDTFNQKVIALKIEPTVQFKKTSKKFDATPTLDEQKLIDGSPKTTQHNEQLVHLVAQKNAAVFFSNIIFHPSQKIEHLKEGKINVFLKVPISPEFCNFILSFQGDIDVESPSELQNNLQKSVQTLYKKYCGNVRQKKAG